MTKKNDSQISKFKTNKTYQHKHPKTTPPIKITHIGKTICIVENEKDGEYTLVFKPSHFKFYTKAGLHSSFDSYMEYKEPVIHTRYVHWYKNNLTGGVWADFTKEPPPTRFFNNSLIKTDIVTYEDKS